MPGQHLGRGGPGGRLVVALTRLGVGGGDGVHLGEAQLGRVEAVGLVDLGDLGVSGLGELNVDALRGALAYEALDKLSGGFGRSLPSIEQRRGQPARQPEW